MNTHYPWIAENIMHEQIIIHRYQIPLSMKHLSNSTNYMNSPNFKTEIGKTRLFRHKKIFFRRLHANFIGVVSKILDLNNTIKDCGGRGFSVSISLCCVRDNSGLNTRLVE